jgi:GDP-fucose transporter C1
MDLAWYSNALTACCMLPLSIIVGEGPKVVEMWVAADGGVAFRRFLWGGAVTVRYLPLPIHLPEMMADQVDLLAFERYQGVFGFLICIAGFLSIKVTSPVSHMVSSAMRGVIQTIIGVSMFGDVITSFVPFPAFSLPLVTYPNANLSFFSSSGA